MGKRREKHPFEDNPFAEGFLDWMDSSEGQLSIEVSDALWDLLEDVKLDAPRRKFIWPDAQSLSLDQSVQRIHQQYPHFPRERIDSFIVSWIEHYAPESYSPEQLDELDRLVEQWLEDRDRQATRGQKPARTRDS